MVRQAKGMGDLVTGDFRFDIRAALKNKSMEVILGKRIPAPKVPRRVIQWMIANNSLSFDELMILYAELVAIFENPDPQAAFEKYKAFHAFGGVGKNFLEET